MRQAVVGLLAHVDAGKTTLAEALLERAGAVRAAGSVDDGSSHLDTDAMERARGITIFSSTAALDWAGAHLTLVDAPGHVDFSAEAERTIAALDAAVLVVGAGDGVQGHTETLWDLLARHDVPTLVFVSKCDLENPGREALLAELAARLSPGCLDAAALLAGDAAVTEEAAATEEAALEEFLETGGLARQTLARLVGERLAWLKVTGGVLRAKAQLTGVGREGPWAEKANELRRYQGASFTTVAEVPAGQVCAVTGLTHVVPGSALGAEPELTCPVLAPVLSYQVIPQPGADMTALVRALRELADEDPMLGVTWQEELQEAHVQLMGEVQQDVVAALLRERHGFDVTFGPGGILYQETVTGPAEGVGHFEPLRHYAEVRVLVEPLPRGAGVEFGTRCSTDDLDLNWQRLALSCAMERDHRGTLTGAPLTDARITLLAGRAHPKHTEGGDFRQAAFRAVRQALMVARERGACELLEPWYRFRLTVPAERVGRALTDLTRMAASFDAPETAGETARIAGEVPASEVGEYALEVARYTGGRGRLSLELAGYRPCHNAEEVVAAAAYDPEADLPNTPDSVFCSHGAGHTVKWADVPAHAHTVVDPVRLRPYRAADASFFSRDTA